LLSNATCGHYGVAFRAVFSTFLVVSVVLVFLALVAIMVIMLSQGRDRGGGGGDALPIFFSRVGTHSRGVSDWSHGPRRLSSTGVFEHSPC
jgi:hypothetical protein